MFRNPGRQGRPWIAPIPQIRIHAFAIFKSQPRSGQIFPGILSKSGQGEFEIPKKSKIGPKFALAGPRFDPNDQGLPCLTWHCQVLNPIFDFFANPIHSSKNSSRTLASPGLPGILSKSDRCEFEIAKKSKIGFQDRSWLAGCSVSEDQKDHFPLQTRRVPMSCPLNHKRFAGSGYTKECSPSASASDLEKRMAEMLAVREAQNAGNFSASTTARMAGPAAPAANQANAPSLPMQTGWSPRR